MLMCDLFLFFCFIVDKQKRGVCMLWFFENLKSCHFVLFTSEERETRRADEKEEMLIADIK